MDLFKLPGVAETIDWTEALMQLDALELTRTRSTTRLGVLAQIPGRHRPAARQRSRPAAGAGQGRGHCCGEAKLMRLCSPFSEIASRSAPRNDRTVVVIASVSDAISARMSMAGGGALLANLMHFARTLRAAGLPVGPGKVHRRGRRRRGGRHHRPAATSTGRCTPYSSIGPDQRRDVRPGLSRVLAQS